MSYETRCPETKGVAMTRKISTGLLLAVLTLLVCTALRVFAGSAPAEEFEVGFTVTRFDAGGRSLALAVWYPAAGGPSFDYYGAVEGRASLDSEPFHSEGPYPLIVFSSGYTGCGIQSVFLTEHLASLGFVVAAPDHSDAFFCSSNKGRCKANWALAGLAGIGPAEAKDRFKEVRALLSGADWRYRTDEVSAAIDSMLAENSRAGSAFAGLIDPDSIGVMGHSLGGWTAFAIGGVEISCVDEDPAGTEGGAVKALDFPGLCSSEVFSGKTTSLRDPRVKAVLGLSPSVWAFPNNEGEPALEIPTMMITGASMDINLADIRDTYDHSPGPRYELILKGVDHMTVSDLAAAVGVTKLIFSGSVFHYPEKKEIFMNYAGGFFRAYLKGDQPAREYIGESHYDRVMLRAEE